MVVAMNLFLAKLSSIQNVMQIIAAERITPILVYMQQILYVCICNKFYMTNFHMTSFIYWCESVNKFTLTIY